MTRLNVSEAKDRFSDLLGRVVQEGETVLITQQGKAVAKLVPASEMDEPDHLVNVKGWLEDDDPFFGVMDEIVEARFEHQPRSAREPLRLRWDE
ncbi:MAG TPA: type II toxin-antitoxin system prevent-host-death family antitoxin [Thermoanaerobaculia bacterium]|nr:type II toxin-antitoxin system prevent-host-death family antitoxin [Thermoanaerobaculia bacterium]